MRPDAIEWPHRERWIDVAWVVFSLANLAAMLVIPTCPVRVPRLADAPHAHGARRRDGVDRCVHRDRLLARSTAA